MYQQIVERFWQSTATSSNAAYEIFSITMQTNMLISSKESHASKEVSVSSSVGLKLNLICWPSLRQQ